MKQPSSLHGYTLVELAIVIALIGVLMGTALSIGGTHVEKKNISATDTSLDEIEEAILRYQRKYNRVPCPASPSLAENTADFGKEDNCSNAAPALAGIVELNDGTGDEQWIGTVPTRSLGLPDRMMLDKWNNRLVYGVQKNFADATKTFENELGNAPATMLKVQDKAGNPINPANVQNPVVYVLLSQGKDKRGAYNKAGAQPISCDASNTQRDVENCDFTVAATKDDVFVDTALSDSKTASEYYYDRIRWKTKVNFGVFVDDSIAAKNLFVRHNGTCILANDNTFQCSGEDFFERNGNGGVTGNTASFTPEANGFTDWKMISGYYDGICGIRTSGRAYCAGKNDYGQVGNATTGADVSTLVEVDGSHPNWTQISKGWYHTCGIRAGTAYCWGRNTVGALGDGTNVDSSVPVAVLGIGGAAAYTDWKFIATGDQNSCGIRGSGQLLCWGFNDRGQLGDSTYVNRNTPVEVLGVGGGAAYPDWKKIGENLGWGACAVRSNGHAYCWGSNDYGQLGDGTTTTSNVPVEVFGSHDNWTSIHTGLDATCGLRGTGVAYCWGANYDGAMGSGVATIPDVHLPFPVTTAISDWKDIAPFCSSHVCAIRPNGALYCWGRNTEGQFGDGIPNASVVGVTPITGITVK
jgi:prepilin-type N-terminal cleavage/methylation domain-containing protein